MMAKTTPKQMFTVEEDDYSKKRHLEQGTFLNQIFSGLNPLPENDSKIRIRQLVLEKRHGHPTYEADNKNTEQEEEDESVQNSAKEIENEVEVSRQKHTVEMSQNSGIKVNTVHGMIIDAGSTGSRMHVYEFAPRILENRMQVNEAVAGNRLSYPGTESRWTERLRPGIDTFASIEDENELHTALENYLSPLVEFAKYILHSKQAMWEIFPIYLKATAGMRKLSFSKRQRVMTAVRNIFYNKTFCPFKFELEFARVISGEEEAIYGWTAVNFLKGSLLTDSAGSGTVMSPDRTYGALDLGGASTQISFYDPQEDIMSNLFKMQIGPGKHWNIYAHSFLQFGQNSAFDRLNARLYAYAQPEEKVSGVYNPCLPGNSSINFTSTIQIDNNGVETWKMNGNESTTYTTIMRNDKQGGDFNECVRLTTGLLNVESNAWCNFEHGNDCSFAGVYQPPLPLKSFEFGYFVGFSNIHHAWDFLNMATTSTLYELADRAEVICSMNFDELKEYNSHRKKKKRLDDVELPRMCFLSSYVYSLLHHGYGFHKSNSIMAVHAVDGNKVTWALGSMLYEINTLPWQYEQAAERNPTNYGFVYGIIGFLLTWAAVWCMFPAAETNLRATLGTSLWSPPLALRRLKKMLCRCCGKEDEWAYDDDEKNDEDESSLLSSNKYGQRPMEPDVYTSTYGSTVVPLQDKKE